MSHFSVQVIMRSEEFTDNPMELLKSLLEPYNEGKEVEPYISQTKQELIDEYRKAKANHMDMPSYLEYSNDPVAFAKNNPDSQGSMEYYRTLPEKVAYTDDQIWGELKESYSGRGLDEDGNLWSTYNPNSKWDWWVQGGRYKNGLTNKSGEKVDFGQVKNLRLGYDEESANRAKRFWEIVVEGDEPKTEEEMEISSFWSDKYYRDNYGTKEEYVRNCALGLPYAFLVDGEWHEPGEMLYWGMSTTKAETRIKYRERYEAMLKTLRPDDIIVVIDCHI